LSEATPFQENVAPRPFDFTIVGDTNVDLLLYGLAEELPLEQELLADGMALQLGGSGAITAHNLAALGNSVDSFHRWRMTNSAACVVKSLLRLALICPAVYITRMRILGDGTSPT